MHETQIRTIFGLKLRQLRDEKKLSLFGLSKKTGLSKSYLNEIEKGKKYPKTDKILILAKALDADYDEMVSLKFSGKMAPVADMISSGILEEVPLHLFGIEEQQLIDIMIHAPDKVNAFISTIFQIARNYNFTRENFYLSSLRSYQELYLNYFPDLEEAAEATLQRFQLQAEGKISLGNLEELLQEEFGYTIDYDTLASENRMPLVRSIYIDGKDKVLIIDPEITDSQKTFLLAKEIGYQQLAIKERTKTFTWIHYNSFEEVLNNFRASYFAGAILIPKENFVNDLKKLFGSKKWSARDLGVLMHKYTDSAETFFQRLTNILPGVFDIGRLFFLRFEEERGSDYFKLTKELHLSRQHQPHASQVDEHYCRRWVSLDILKNPEKYQVGDLEIGIQRSSYVDSDNEYLVISTRQPDPFKPNYFRSISVGIEVSDKLKSQVAFLNDKAIPRKQVSVTCENCPLKGCEDRAVEATRYNKVQENDEIDRKVNAIMKAYK